MKEGGHICLAHLGTGRQAKGLPLILAHGTLSNAGTVEGLGRYLAGQGYDVWLLEWGGHGKSLAPQGNRDFEAPAFADLPQALDFVRARTGHAKVFWIGHSGGGLLALMHLARYPQAQDCFAGLALLGSQATDAARTFAHKVRAVFLYGLTRIMGRTPRLFASMGDEGEPTQLLAQWAVWNLSGRWLGRDGFNYLSALESLKIPCLVMAGTRDVIAPAKGCRQVFDRLGSQDKTWVLCGKAQGFSREFSHGGLVYESTARQEVFPMILDWLREYQTAV